MTYLQFSSSLLSITIMKFIIIEVNKQAYVTGPAKIGHVGT